MGAVFTIMTVIFTALAATAVGAAQVILDRDLITAVNTALNLASWWLLIKAQSKLRHEVAPKLDHVEEVVTAALETREPGGRRQNDPPECDK